MKTDKPTIAIIGPGTLGAALGVRASAAGYRIAAVGGRDAGKAAATARRIGPDVVSASAERAAGLGDLVLLTVSDEAIAPLCRQLADAKAFRKDAVVAHCSGAWDSEALRQAAEICRCKIGSMHPLQTFPTIDAAIASIPGAYFFIEGQDEACKALTALASAMGGHPIRIDPAAKPLYHAAAVMACNFLAALLEASLELGEKAGIDRGTFLPALAPLVRATIDNILAMGPAKALTGPVARGDVRTVVRHLDAMRGQAEGLDALYAMLAARTALLAVHKGTLSPQAAGDLLSALTHAGENSAAKAGNSPRRKGK